jgi:hypothetical protein
MIVIPMTPVAESIPITVSTEIAVIAVPTHHCRRRPEPRTIHPSAPNPTLHQEPGLVEEEVASAVGAPLQSTIARLR